MVVEVVRLDMIDDYCKVGCPPVQYDDSGSFSSLSEKRSNVNAWGWGFNRPARGSWGEVGRDPRLTALRILWGGVVVSCLFVRRSRTMYNERSEYALEDKMQDGTSLTSSSSHHLPKMHQPIPPHSKQGGKQGKASKSKGSPEWEM